MPLVSFFVVDNPTSVFRHLASSNSLNKKKGRNTSKIAPELLFPPSFSLVLLKNSNKNRLVISIHVKFKNLSLGATFSEQKDSAIFLCSYFIRLFKINRFLISRHLSILEPFTGI